MKLILRNSFLLFLLFVSVLVIATQGGKLYASVKGFFGNNTGVLTIFSVDAENGYPIKSATYQLIDPVTNEVIQELSTSDKGIAQSNEFPVGTHLQVVQTNVISPYQLNTEPELIELAQEKETLKISNELRADILAFERTANREIVPTEMNLPVEKLLQKPELPNGCEVTALTAVLNFYGYEVEKTTLSDQYLPKVAFEVMDGKLYGADPFKAYAGDPRSAYQGFFSYTPPIMETVKRYFTKANGTHQPVDVSGSSEEELLALIKQGIPVIMWMTVDLTEPLQNYSWYITGTEKRIDVLRNSHTVVLTGFSEQDVYVMDPLKGNVAYPKDRFFDIYEKVGSHAMIIQ
ncbi:C39 family peptidase [Ornithinibacillus contaminans]|uniref:C39 family peptidase n=1 Tax=Ornithinibacillus contaminans TaxID=694055 RepID=UPI00064DBEC6|nr:C39 family peptidase [Ornithinibacillus contaminans]